MPHKIERLNSVTGTITATASAGTSPTIPYGAASGGMLFVDSVASGANSITWHAAPTQEGTPVPVKSDGSGVTTSIAASNAYALPDELFGAPFLVAVTNAGTATFRISVKG